MKQIRWFDRKFDFSKDQNIFPSIIERLSGTSLRLVDKISKLNSEIVTIRYEKQWSIAENIGHLIDLEPLWQGRLQDILGGKEEMRPADLENKKTDSANHNSKGIKALLDEFTETRKDTVSQISNLAEKDVFRYALHPRLKTPMRVMDLFLFVAEHDDHHLARITTINKSLTEN